MTTRTITADGLRELFAQHSGSVMLALVTFDHSTLPEPVRLVNDTRSLEYGGNTYIALPFELDLPDDVEDKVPSIELKVDNVDRRMVQLLRSVSDPPDVTIEIVRVSNGMVTGELGPLDFSLLDASITAETVTLQIGYAVDILNEPATQHIFNPGTAPALFA